ncbi:FAD-dependent oxidoreductase [Rhodalgimonas zhirmunskyi]|uniref:FAD-dependent monooxygenase n=1 Tax=Rhodalgimonas zhirmunskyi TaxID=2964767 RepID=A0AAJ1UAT7_9RHOB|nr:NAD(P)/FAD-dependent oxidoreductase [Rhodoalgimonas zhirmunskyi]MDQ2092837.1 FAD-dependent monooxygenase [Rhodoalgimonas zhirmunskyi]
MNILIVGAGPTGLTAAVELSRRGLIPQIIEQRPSPSGLSRAVGILDHSLDLLTPSGVADAIRSEAISVQGFIIHHEATPLGCIPLAGLDGASLHALAQDRTETHLHDALNRYGGKVRYGVSFLGLAQDDTGVTVDTSDGTERYDLVIGADGVGSQVRKALGLAYPGHTLPETWSIADVDARGWPDPDWFQAFLLPAGQVAIVVPLEKDRFRAISSTPDVLADLPRKLDVSHVHRTGTFTIQVRQVEDYAKGRVYLAGDAAHSHSPVGGRGMNLGIADAAELAQRIADATLEGYSAARHAKGQHVITLSERARKLVQSKSWLTRAGVETALRVITHVPPLAAKMGREIADA